MERSIAGPPWLLEAFRGNEKFIVVARSRHVGDVTIPPAAGPPGTPHNVPPQPAGGHSPDCLVPTALVLEQPGLHIVHALALYADFTISPMSRPSSRKPQRRLPPLPPSRLPPTSSPPPTHLQASC